MPYWRQAHILPIHLHSGTVTRIAGPEAWLRRVTYMYDCTWALHTIFLSHADRRCPDRPRIHLLITSSIKLIGEWHAQFTQLNERFEGPILANDASRYVSLPDRWAQRLLTLSVSPLKRTSPHSSAWSGNHFPIASYDSVSLSRSWK